MNLFMSARATFVTERHLVERRTYAADALCNESIYSWRAMSAHNSINAGMPDSAPPFFFILCLVCKTALSFFPRLPKP